VLSDEIRSLYAALDEVGTHYPDYHEYTPALRRLRSVAWVLSEFFESKTTSGEEGAPGKPYIDILSVDSFNPLTASLGHAVTAVSGLRSGRYDYGNVSKLAEARSWLIRSLRNAIDEIRDDIQKKNGEDPFATESPYGPKDLERTRELSVALAGEVARRRY